MFYILVVSSLNGCLYVAGGYDVGDNHLRRVEKYDSVKDEWIKVEDMKKIRYDAGKKDLFIKSLISDIIIIFLYN